MKQSDSDRSVEKKIEQYLLYLLGRREYSRAELHRKAIAKINNTKKPFRSTLPADSADAGARESIDPDTETQDAMLERILNQLVEKGWLSDSRFCECYIRTQSDKGYGPQRIRYELEQKGVAQSVILDIEDTLNIDWNANLEQQMGRRFPQYRALSDKKQNPKEKSRIVRFFQYRGYALHDIARLIK